MEDIRGQAARHGVHHGNFTAVTGESDVKRSTCSVSDHGFLTHK